MTATILKKITMFQSVQLYVGGEELFKVADIDVEDLACAMEEVALINKVLQRAGIGAGTSFVYLQIENVLTDSELDDIVKLVERYKKHVISDYVEDGPGSIEQERLFTNKEQEVFHLLGI